MRGRTQRPSKWTFEAVVAHVKENGYSAKREWCNQHPGSYQTSRNNGWVDAVCVECDLDVSHKRKWVSVRQVIDAVKQKGHKTLSEWGASDSSSYRAALTHGWLDIVMAECGIRKQHTRWESVEQVVAVVKDGGFVTKVEWIEKHNRSYATAVRFGWIDAVCEACGITNSNRAFDTVWDILDVVKPMNYGAKQDWATNDGGSYGAAVRLKCVGEVCSICNIPDRSSSYRPSRPHWIYLVLVTTSAGVYLGYGCSAVIKTRMKQHRTNAKKAGASVRLVSAFEFQDWSTARDAERSIKDTFNHVDTGVYGFRTEATHLHNLASVRSYLESMTCVPAGAVENEQVIETGVECK